MAPGTRFFPSFHKHLFGRRPLRGLERLARQTREAYPQRLEEVSVVIVVMKDRLPPVPTRHDMIKCSRKLDAKAARHPP